MKRISEYIFNVDEYVYFMNKRRRVWRNIHLHEHVTTQTYVKIDNEMHESHIHIFIIYSTTHYAIYQTLLCWEEPDRSLS